MQAADGQYPTRTTRRLIEPQQKVPCSTGDECGIIPRLPVVLGTTIGIPWAEVMTRAKDFPAIPLIKYRK